MMEIFLNSKEMVAKVGITLTREQQKELRKQELQAQGYCYYGINAFLDQSCQIKKILELDDKTFRRFNHFDLPDHIITTLGPGVYIFFRDRKIQYIGSSKEMKDRIKQHTKYKPGDKIITIGTMTEEEARRIEGHLILEIRPGRNKKKTWGGK